MHIHNKEWIHCGAQRFKIEGQERRPISHPAPSVKWPRKKNSSKNDSSISFRRVDVSLENRVGLWKQKHFTELLGVCSKLPQKLAFGLYILGNSQEEKNTF